MIRPEAREIPPPIRVTFEFISLDLKDLSKLLRDHGGDADAAKMREAAGRLIEQKRAELVDRIALRCSEGRRARFESTEEVIYSTEADPPEGPNELTLMNSDPANLRHSPATQAAFETRHTGQIFLIDGSSVGKENSRFVKLDISTVEIVKLLRKDRLTHPDHPLESMMGQWMAIFYTTRTAGELLIRDRSTALCATFQPEKGKPLRLMIFAKVLILKTDEPADESKQD